MRKIKLLLISLLITVVLVGCGNQSTNEISQAESNLSASDISTTNPKENNEGDLLVSKETSSNDDANDTQDNVPQPKSANLFKNSDSKDNNETDDNSNNRQSTTSFKVESNTNWISTEMSGSRTLANITFKEPTEWNPTTAKSPAGMYYYPYGDKSTGLIYVSYQKVSKSNPSSKDYIEFINATVESKDMVEDSKSVKIAGVDGYMATVKLTVASSGDYEAIEYVFADGSYIYSFMFGDKGSLSKEMKDFSSQMINTVTINKSNSDTATSKDTDTKKEEKPKQEEKKEESSSTSTTVTTGQKNALSSAKNYLKIMPFSHKGLQEQLKYEGYTSEEALYAADNCNADWNAQALKAAKQYLSTMAFSAKGLKEQLAYDGYTSDQAQYGVDNCGADWNEQAKKSAASYLSIMSFSRSELIEQLKYDGYTSSQAEYGASANGY